MGRLARCCHCRRSLRRRRCRRRQSRRRRCARRPRWTPPREPAWRSNDGARLERASTPAAPLAAGAPPVGARGRAAGATLARGRACYLLLLASMIVRVRSYATRWIKFEVLLPEVDRCVWRWRTRDRGEREEDTTVAATASAAAMLGSARAASGSNVLNARPRETFEPPTQHTSRHNKSTDLTLRLDHARNRPPSALKKSACGVEARRCTFPRARRHCRPRARMCKTSIMGPVALRCDARARLQAAGTAAARQFPPLSLSPPPPAAMLPRPSPVEATVTRTRPTPLVNSSTS
jgi:hypothetical protein